MAVADAAEPATDHAVETEHRVTPLELFFDLVFVFALTQITSLLADDPTPGGLARGALLLGMLWWAWVAYAWLTNSIDPEADRSRLTMFVAMGAMLVASLAVPGAFGDDALLFGCAYAVVRLLHLTFYARAAEDAGVRDAVGRLAPSVVIASALIVAAAAFDGALQGALWTAALVIDFAGPVLRGVRGWRVHAGHFAERHGLIVIIALGESIVAIGVGAEGIALGPGEVTAAVLGLAVVAALWWAYFDVVAVVAERRMSEARGEAQLRLARDSYTFLHFPMILGIVLLALGVKKTLAHVGDPLALVPAVGLCGGVAIYLAGHIGFRWRNVHSLSRSRLVAGLLCLALIPVATVVPGLVALAGIAAICVGLIAYEVTVYREARARIRAARA